MENNIETLADFVTRKMNEARLTSYDVQLHSGHDIHQSYVIKIKYGQVHNISATKLKALAKGLGVLEAEIFAVVRGVPMNVSFSNERFESMSLKFDQLPSEKQQRAYDFLKMLHRYLDELKHEE